MSQGYTNDTITSASVVACIDGRTCCCCAALVRMKVDGGVAVCLVGEIRSLVFPVVQQRLDAKLLRPLGADAFLIASRRWSRPATVKERSGHIGAGVRRPHWRGVPDEVSSENVTRIRAALPAIRAAIVAEDEQVLKMAAIDAVEGSVELGDRCGASALRYSHDTSNRPSRQIWTMEVCVTRFVHAIRLRLSLRLIEEAEAERRQPYRTVIRTRPDVWMPWCALTHASIGAHIHGRGDWAALSWDYMTVMPRMVASTSLRELHLAPAVGICQRADSREWCNVCILRQQGFVLLKLHGDVTIARHCQLIEDEKAGKQCTTFSGPPPLSAMPRAAFSPYYGSSLGKSESIRACMARDDCECHPLDGRMYYFGTVERHFANKTLGCDDDGSNHAGVRVQQQHRVGRYV